APSAGPAGPGPGRTDTAAETGATAPGPAAPPPVGSTDDGDGTGGTNGTDGAGGTGSTGSSGTSRPGSSPADTSPAELCLLVVCLG
ncbi:hypothetical protein ACFVFN_39115, partial [Streptomyces pharetrae]